MMNFTQEQILQLIASGLPEGATAVDVFNSSDPKLVKSIADWIEELRNNSFINWHEYLEKNPDVKDAGVDPVSHFISHGIKEGRKLSLSIPTVLQEEPVANIRPAPKISIIVPNYNNGVFLRKTVSTLMGQTLDDIEIIIVDDGSQDDSVKIIRDLQKRDSRILLIELQKNQGTHMAKKIGVSRASGQFVMFMDPDDFYKRDACEQAYQLASQGYDMAIFNLSIINHSDLPKSRIASMARWYDALPSGSYSGPDILKKTFLEYRVPCFLHSKIFRREVIQKAFREMEDGRYVLYEDMYEFLVICYFSKSILKSNLSVYHYAIGVGASLKGGSLEKFAVACTPKCIIQPIRDFCKANNLLYLYSHIKMVICGFVLENLPFIPLDASGYFFGTLVSEFGKLFAIKCLRREYSKKEEIVARLFGRYRLQPRYPASRAIALICSDVVRVGMKQVLESLCEYLRQSGCEPTILAPNPDIFEEAQPEKFDVQYLPAAIKADEPWEARLNQLSRLLDRGKFNSCIFMNCTNELLLWDLMLAQLCGISTSGYYYLEYQNGAVLRNRDYPHAALLAVLRCLKDLYCSSKEISIYFASTGINSHYLSMPKASNLPEVPFEKRSNMILALASAIPGSDKWEDWFEILAEIKKKITDASLILVCKFKTSAEAEAFRTQSARYGVSDSIRIQEETEDLMPLLKGCKASIITSFINENAPLCDLARQYGLPVLRYAIQPSPHMKEKGILETPYGDRKKMINELLLMMQDQDHWHRYAYPQEEQKPSNIPNPVHSQGNPLSSAQKLWKQDSFSLADYQDAIRTLSNAAQIYLPL